MHNYDMNPLCTLMTMSESQKDLDYTLLTVHTHPSVICKLLELQFQLLQNHCRDSKETSIKASKIPVMFVLCFQIPTSKILIPSWVPSSIIFFCVSEIMGEFRVHHIRFFNYQPKTINCIAYSKELNKVALSRWVLYHFTTYCMCTYFKFSAESSAFSVQQTNDTIR